MKLYTTESEFDSFPPLNRIFLIYWHKKKGYPFSKKIDYCVWTELAFALTNDLQFDSVSERLTFNNVLQYDEYSVGWDGQEPIDILAYKVNEKLKRRINQYLIVNERTV